MTGNGKYRIVVGVDGSAESRAAMDWAVEEAKLRDGRVLAVTAWNFPYLSNGFGQAWSYEGFETDAQAILDEERARVLDQGVEITGRVAQGSPASVLVEASRDADVVAIGSRGLGGFAGLVLGSTSTQTVHHAHCPVLVFREHS
ncbi:MAG: universal stress protein [Arthrobacter sp.]|nr:universal stress protein [Arthrobacter sp.]